MMRQIPALNVQYVNLFRAIIYNRHWGANCALLGIELYAMHARFRELFPLDCVASLIIPLHIFKSLYTNSNLLSSH